MSGVTYEGLAASSNHSVVRAIVRRHIELIDAAIATAHTAGFSSITYDLPSSFDINNLSKADAQLVVYTDLIMTYKKEKGFAKTYIEWNQQSRDPYVALHIEWSNGLDRQRRLRCIQECTVMSKK